MPKASFKSAFARLNPAQKKAVETIEGPVMVIAGPGTGKTETLAVRVANILAKTQMRPSNILCLTFTKSGATAMRERLRNLVGADAYGVTINTIHGFCNDIIGGHPEVFEEWDTLEQISDIERYRAVNSIIDELMPHCILVSRKFPYTRTKQIIDRISTLKREGVIDEKKLRGIAQTYEQEMHGKSREGTKQHEKNLRAARKFKELLEVFFRYQAMLTETGRYDYEDMILRAIQVLREEDWLLASLQERYQYILLDEAQDTNGAQWQLVELLTTDPTGDKSPNLFVVGDDDQAIYRFQGANLQNILAFHERFPKAPIITLTESYRSTQAILDSAGMLITKNTERLVGRIPGMTKELHAAGNAKGHSPMLIRAPSDMSEPWLIADLVQERLELDVPPEEIAVIVQTNAELQPIAEVLQSRGIPVEMTGKVNLLAHTIVHQAVTMLKAIEAPRQNNIFVEALAAPCFAVPAMDIARLSTVSRERKMAFPDIIVALKHGEFPDVRLFAPEKILSAGEFLLSLHQGQSHRTIVETLEKLLRESGLLRTANGKELDIIDISVTQEFFDRVKNRAYEQPDFTLSKLLRDIEFYENQDYKDLKLSYDLPHITERGIRLMTAHKSKGLEFRIVILANFRDNHWNARRNPPGIGIPEDLLFGWEKPQKDFERGQDERRVAYVAMTRAKEEVIFICPKETTTGENIKAVSPSAFFAEAGDLSEEDRGIRSPEKASTLLYPVIREKTAETEAFLKEQIANFMLSPSALNDFLSDPKIFFEKYLLRLPEARDPSYAYGNAIHHVLAEWGTAMHFGQQMDEETLLRKFREHLTKREVLAPKEQGRLLHLGEEALQAFHRDVLEGTATHIYKVEYQITWHLGDIPLKGKIDRIDLASEKSAEATIYDYKTGKPKSPAEIEKYGYRRQLIFYDILVRGALPILKPKEYVLQFVGEDGDEPMRRAYTFTEEERHELEELIRVVWGKITALDFTAM